jgi:hypothetical protein
MLKFGLPPLIALCLLLLSTSGASAASASLTVDPASVTKNPNDTFTLTLKVTSDVPLGGAATNVQFNPLVVQLTDIAKGSAFDGAQLIVGVAPNNTKELAIADANATGTLKQVTTYFNAGSSAPAGTNDFVVLTMKAVGGGTTAISLVSIGSQTQQPFYPMETTDAGGNKVPVTATAGSVTVTGQAITPSPTPSPTPVGQTPTPSPTPSPSPTPTLPAEASLWVSPATLAVRPGTEFSIDIKQTTNQATAGSQFSFGFDPNLLQVISVTKSTTFSKANLVMGVAPVGGSLPSKEQTIAEANTTGLLRGISGFVAPPNPAIPAGSATFVTIKFKSKTTIGSSDIKLSEVEMLKPDGTEVGVATTNGKVDVSNSAPAVLPTTGGSPGASDDTGWLVVLGGLLAVLAGGAAVSVARRRF